MKTFNQFGKGNFKFVKLDEEGNVEVAMINKQDYEQIQADALREAAEIVKQELYPRFDSAYTVTEIIYKKIESKATFLEKGQS